MDAREAFYRRKVIFKQVKKHAIVLIVDKDIGFVDPAIKGMIDAAGDVGFDAVFMWHYP